MKSRRPISLRNRITIVLMTVLIIALAGANLVLYTMASRGLDQRFGEQLNGLSAFGQGLAIAASSGFGPGNGRPLLPSDPALPAAPGSADGAYVGVIDHSGAQSLGLYLMKDPTGREPPILPPHLEAQPGHPAVFDSTAVVDGSSQPYRVQAVAQPNGSVVVAALPTSGLAHDQQSLAIWEALATVLVVGLFALLTRWLVGVSLRPLEQIEAAAERIANGDLTHRVEPSGPETEISRLGLTLNHMLSEIEEVFADKERSERELLASEARLRTFAADASHELRTPLTSIRGYAQLLRRGKLEDPDDRAKAAARIEDEATRLATLVDDLLVLTRLDNGAPLPTVSVDLNDIVGRVVDDFRVIQPDRAISFTAASSSFCLGDSDSFSRVVNNLLANACQHAPSATPIEVVMRPDSPPSDIGSVIIEVIDHGPGIDPKSRPLVFDRFYRSDTSRNRGNGGAGLGLAIVQGIVNAHHGTCEVTDTPDGGATFRITLPKIVDRPPTPTPTPPLEPVVLKT